VAGLRRVLFVSAAIAAYWCFARWLLFRAFPVSEDGYGIVVSFYWGHHQPSAYPEIGYAYLVAASIFTLLGCGTVWLVQRRKSRPLRAFLISWAAAFFVFCSAVGVSDLGTRFHIWRGPTAFRTSETPSFYPAFLDVIVYLSLVTGLLALARNRSGHSQST
jgi:hypothetical protein